MKIFLKKILGPLLTKIAAGASAPDKKGVFASLTKLLSDLNKNKNNRGLVLEIDFNKDRFIIFSDHHKGNKDHGDDFASNEKNYLAALDYYFSNQFSYITLGDSEELWKYKPGEIISKNGKALASEARFHELKKYFKTFGNHDLTWKNKLDVDIWFKGIFILPLPVYEGLILKTKIDNKPLSIFITHGHQGDKMSDNNGCSTWIVSHIWRPLQRYLKINVNTPAKDYELTDEHNIMMYEWSRSKKKLALITGHTHKPVFAAGLYSNHPSNNIP
ncbi:MAG: metallophosphoesterase, partial [Ginsengibacter sp.]